MAPPSTRVRPLQIDARRRLSSARQAIEHWLEAERDQLPLWLPVMLGAGVAAWFVLPGPREWVATALAALAIAAAALGIGRGGRAGLALGVAGVAIATGVGLAWWRAERVAAPVLAREATVTLTARVERVEPLPARGLVRLRLATIAAAPLQAASGRALPTMPPHVRVNLQVEDAPAGLAPGAVIRFGVRLMPPPGAAVPGAYDYSRAAWFDRVGATGRGFAPVTVVTPGVAERWGVADLRQRLSQHIQSRLAGSAGGVADALATGNMGAITQADSDAMRRAGLAHLLSVSGLHITATVGAAMFVTLRLLALWPWLALRVRLPLVAGGVGALAAVGYTLLTGAEVPTIRSCVAALTVLVALALGREAITLRLVAFGALIVLLLYPESLAGPSFQLSFAAVTAIIALHEHPQIRNWFGPHEERWWWRTLRQAASLLLTGLLVELALMPIAVFHFHKAGVYGAAANIVAIPLTTFVVMPLEALALLLDAAGLGGPAWWLAGQSLAALLWLAHATAGLPGAVAALPAMPGGAYALMVAGGLWVALWRTRWRRLGLAPLAIGAAWALMTPAPDLLVTGDGRHVGIRTASGGVAILRDRAGDYVRQTLAENGGVDGDPLLLAEQPDARCSRDLCLVERRTGGRAWRILATRSAYMVPADQLIAACAGADVVVSERDLPRRCRPRWLKLDRATLTRTGGVAVTLATGSVVTVRRAGDAHPWRLAEQADPIRRDRGWRARPSGRSSSEGHTKVTLARTS